MAARLVNYLQMVGHYNVVFWCLKELFEQPTSTLPIHDHCPPDTNVVEQNKGSKAGIRQQLQRGASN